MGMRAAAKWSNLKAAASPWSPRPPWGSVARPHSLTVYCPKLRSPLGTEPRSEDLDAHEALGKVSSLRVDVPHAMILRACWFNRVRVAARLLHKGFRVDPIFSCALRFFLQNGDFRRWAMLGSNQRPLPCEGRSVML
jgi:hypothetical protein